MSDHIWHDGENSFRELIRQPYSNCTFSGGQVLDHPIDTLYIKWDRHGGEAGWLLLRPDEVAALNWIAAGLLWSVHVEELGT